MSYSVEFKNNNESSNHLDKPKTYLEKLPGEIMDLVIQEIKTILMNPFDSTRSHDLREPWAGFMGWYPNVDSKIKDYRILYRVGKKVQIYRIGHHSEVYNK